MARVVVVGGSIAGLAAALAFAKHGNEVLVLERGSPPPDGPAGEAGQRWSRPTVPSFGHSHTLPSLGVTTLLERAPEVIKAALDADAVLLDVVPGAGELVALACRRPTLEVVLHRIVESLPGVEIRHGVRVTGLNLVGRRVTGVLAAGELLPAEIVIDATGRSARARAWLAALGIPLAPDRAGPTAMHVFCRFYERHGAMGPLNRGNAAGGLDDHHAAVLHPGDGRTFSVAFGVLPGNRSLRQADSFTAAARATPFIQDWLETAEPTSEIRVLTSPPNLLRTLAVAPPVAGLYPVGDAACVTDPMYGRGMSLAIAHAFRLVEPGADAARIARELLEPWFTQSTLDSVDRIARWRATVTGDPQPPDPEAMTIRVAAAAAAHDPQVRRGLVEVLMGLRQPAEVFGDPAFAERVRELACPGPRC